MSTKGRENNSRKKGSMYMSNNTNGTKIQSLRILCPHMLRNWEGTTFDVQVALEIVLHCTRVYVNREDLDAKSRVTYCKKRFRK